MSIEIPPELDWVVKIAAGQAWPKGDEDRLSDLGDVWYDTRNQLAAVNNDIAPMASGMRDALSGPAAEQFGLFVKQLNDTMPLLVETTGQLGSMSKETAVQTQYSKLMILLQLIWMAEQIIEWSSTIWGLAVVPEIEAVGRVVIQQIAKRFVMSVVSATAIQTGMDALVQAFQMFVLKDRTSWNTDNTKGAAEMGAIGGAVGGVFHEVGHYFAPDFTKSLAGRLTIAGASGITTAGISNAAFGGEQDLGLAIASGIAGGMFAGRGGRGKDDPKDPPIDPSAMAKLLELAKDTEAAEKLSEFHFSETSLEPEGGLPGFETTKVSANGSGRTGLPGFESTGSGGHGGSEEKPAVGHESTPAPQETGTTSSTSSAASVRESISTEASPHEVTAQPPVETTTTAATTQTHGAEQQQQERVETPSSVAQRPATVSDPSAVSGQHQLETQSDVTQRPTTVSDPSTVSGQHQLETQSDVTQRPTTVSDPSTVSGQHQLETQNAATQHSTPAAESHVPAEQHQLETQPETQADTTQRPTSVSEPHTTTTDTGAVTPAAVKTESGTRSGAASQDTQSAQNRVSLSSSETSHTEITQPSAQHHATETSSQDIVTPADKLPATPPAQHHPAETPAPLPLHTTPAAHPTASPTAHPTSRPSGHAATPQGARHFAPPTADPHTWTGPARHIAEFTDKAQAKSFLAHYGIGFGRTLNLRDAADLSTAAHEQAARDLIPDPTGRLTIAVHGEAGLVRIGDHQLTAKAFAQLVREHPDWEQAQTSGVRLIACDTGAAAEGGRSFAQDLADELGVHVVAPTKKVWTSHDGMALVADPNPRQPHLPLLSSKGVFHDFAPSSHVDDASHVNNAGHVEDTSHSNENIAEDGHTPEIKTVAEPTDHTTTAPDTEGTPGGHQQTPAHDGRTSQDPHTDATPGSEDKSAPKPTAAKTPSQPGTRTTRPGQYRFPDSPIYPPRAHDTHGRPGSETDTPGLHAPTASHTVPDLPRHEPLEGADHERWQENVLQWSRPFDAAPPGHGDLVPWYNRPGQNTHALGDLSVVSADRPTGIGGHVTTLMRNLKQSALTNPAGTPETLGTHISRGLAHEFEHEVTKALESTDPAEWQTLLRSGLTLGDGDTVLRVRFRLTGNAEAPTPPDRDPVLSEFLSKYGDIAFVRAAVRETSRGLGFVAEIIKNVGTALSSIAVSIKPGVTLTRGTRHAVADEVQLGNRATNGPRVGVAHGITVEVDAHLTDGRTVTATEDVAKTVTAAYPRVYGSGTPTDLAANVIRVGNPRAVERFDYTLGAVDTKPLEDAFLRTLIGDGRVAPKNAAKVVDAATEGFLDEKSVRDRGQALFTASLPTNFVKQRGFSGYTDLRATVVSLERVDTAAGDGIRNDIAETVTVSHGTTHGQEAHIRVGPEFSVTDGITAAGSIGAKMSSQHGAASQAQGQAKTAVIHGGDKVRYKAVIRIDGKIDADRRFHLGLDHAGRTDPVLDFHASVTGEIMVPSHQATAFEAAVQGAAPARPHAGHSGVDHAAARRVAVRLGPSLRLPGLRPADAVAHPKLYQRMLRLTASHSSPFPRNGLADGTDNAALFRYARRQSDGSVALHVAPGHAFSAAELEHLVGLQADHGLRVFEMPANTAGQHRELTVTRVPPQPPDPLTGVVPPAPHGVGAYQVGRANVNRADAFTARHGLVLDAQGVSHGWNGKPDAMAPNPARLTAPGPRPVVLQDRQNVMSLTHLAAGAGAPARNIGLVAPAAAHRGPGLDAAVTIVNNKAGLHVAGFDDEHSLLGHANLPAEGYVANAAGKVVWGWRDGSANQWGNTGPARHAALVDLARQAGRTGLQLVVERGSRFETDLRAAVTAVRPPGWHTSQADMAARHQLQNRISRAREDDGAGLDALTPAELTQLLVTDRSVRVVDEHGIALPDLNAREVVRETLTPNGAGPAVRTFHVTQGKPVDTSLKMHEEFAVRQDGQLLRSVAWKPDGTLTGHARRAVHDSDVQAETPELVAGVGLGSAAFKELPGGELVHATVKSIVTDLSGNHGAIGDGPRATARRDGASARLRFRLDKQLQLTFGTPKLRGARGRGLDTGIQEEFQFRGRTYKVSVDQVLLDRPSGAVPTEPGLAIDHQVKGTRGGGTSVTRNWEVNGEAGIGYRVELPHGGAIDIGDFSAGLSGGKSHVESDGTASKGYSRLRAGAGNAHRPEYDTRYQVTVTETTRRWTGFTDRRTVSRIIDGDGVTVPAIVHEFFRPDNATAADPNFIQANRRVVSTMGRTSALTDFEFQDLQRHPDRIDFSRTGTDGLHATFAGLDPAVRAATKLVISQAKQANPHIPASAWRHPTYVAEVERAIAEGFLRSNLPRLLSEEGLPIPLPKETHWGIGLPNAERSFKVRGFFVASDPAAGHAAPRAGIESYSEHDLKQTDSDTSHMNWSLGGAIGPAYKPPTGEHEGTGNGSDAPTTGPDGGPAPTSAAKRGIANKFSATISGEIGGTIFSDTEAKTKGSIDVSLLTENVGQQFSRAHLVLEVVADRQPVDAGLVTGLIGRTFRSSAYDATPKTARLFVENAVELSMSNTLTSDLATPARLDVPPKANQTRFITRHDTAFAAGYATHFEDKNAIYEATVQGNATPVRLPARTGITGAIKEGLRSTGLVGPEHLTDASDVWRGITAKFDPEEIKAHPHDLLNTGVTHRVEVPGWLGSTRRLTVRVTAVHDDSDHIRQRQNGQVTLGGQSLKQDAKFKRSGFDASVGGEVGGQFTRDGHDGGTPSTSVKWSMNRESTTGNQAVVRDIRRATSMNGEAEEFQHKLKLKIEIFADSELPEPLARIPHYGVNATDRTPLVRIETVTDPAGRQTHVTMRNVVPRHLTEARQVTDPIAPRPPAPTPPRVRMSTNTDRSTPSMLEHELGSKLQALTFPDLEHVAAWAPAATRSRAENQPYVDGTIGGAAGTPTPPRMNRFGPTTDLGVRMTSSLTNRNVRDNTRDLFEAKFELPSTSGEPTKLGVQVKVIRPTGDPTAYNGLTFMERADEPAFSESAGSGWSGGLAFGGSTNDGAGLPSFDPGQHSGVENEATVGDYVEYNRQYTGDSYSYGGKATYVISDGSSDHSLRITSSKNFEGLLPEGWAKKAAEDFPSQVVHPHAKPLSDDGATRANQIAAIRATATPGLPDPLHVVADLNTAVGADTYVRAARQLAIDTNRTVDLALVHYDAAGDADRLEHHVFDPAANDHVNAAADLRNHELLEPQRATRQGDLTREGNRLTEITDANRRTIAQGRDARQALADHIAGDPRSIADLNRAIADAQQAHMDAVRTVQQAGQGNGRATQAQITARFEAGLGVTRAQDALRVRQDLEAQANRLGGLADAAQRVVDRQAEQVRQATLRMNEVNAAQTRSAASHLISATRGSGAGTALVQNAEHTSDLSALATPQATVTAAWQRTPSGFALPSDNTHLAVAHDIPARANTTVVAVGGTRDDDGNYTVRGRVMTTQELADSIVEQLYVANGDTALPQRIIIHGDDSGALAQAVSTENARRLAPPPPAPAHGGAAVAPVPPPAAPPHAVPGIDVIGSRGTVATLQNGSTWTGTLSAAADRFLHTWINPPTWLVYRDGVLVPAPGRYQHTDLATLIAALEAPTSLPLLPWVGARS